MWEKAWRFKPLEHNVELQTKKHRIDIMGRSKDHLRHKVKENRSIYSRSRQSIERPNDKEKAKLTWHLNVEQWDKLIEKFNVEGDTFGRKISRFIQAA